MRSEAEAREALHPDGPRRGAWQGLLRRLNLAAASGSMAFWSTPGSPSARSQAG